MKALKIISIFCFFYSSHAIAADIHNTNPKNTHKDSKLEKSNLPEESTNFLKLVVFDIKAVSIKKDTSLTNHIKPDFDSLILPENKLWLKRSDK